MAFNGSGTFLINSAGQPVVYNTIIDEIVFNALTADLATGLSTCITKDGQTTVTADIPMGGFSLTGLAAGAANGESVRYEQLTTAHPLSMCEMRLSASASLPVTVTDATAITSLRIAPYKGERVAIYNGTVWEIVPISANFGVSIPATTNTPFDVFLYNNSGAVGAETVNWTNDTTRATALTTQDGVYVKTGDTTRRYVGTCRTTGVSGQIEDSFAKRFIWNYYNRVCRPMRVLEATNTWNYTTATIRQANNSAANQLDFVIGASEDSVSATLMYAALNSTGGVAVNAGLGLDTTTAFTVGQLIEQVTTATGEYRFGQAHLKTFPGVGRHYISWNEYSGAVGTTTWAGDAGAGSAEIQCGLHGEIWA